MKVCFVCPYAYRLFDPAAGGRFGGSEVRARLFGRALADWGGYEVSFAVFGAAAGGPRRIEGIDVFDLPRSLVLDERWVPRLRERVRRQSGFPWLKLDRPAAALAWELPMAVALRTLMPIERELYFRRFDYPPRRRVLSAIDADVYCTFGTHHITAEVAAFARRAAKKSLLLLSSDYDLLPWYRAGSREKNIYGELGHACHYGLAHAEQIVAQTVQQQSLLMNRFGRDSELVANPLDMSGAPQPAARAAHQGYALWIGKADEYKRPRLCLELAARCPEVPFQMIVNRADEGALAQVMAERGANVRIVEQVPRAEMGHWFSEAAVLVNTSAYEGFPNSFLEAGKFGVPVVSLAVDPDGFLSTHRCGVCAGGDMERMADAVRRIWRGEPVAAEYTETIRAYVAERHDLKRCVAAFEAVVRRLAGGANRE